MLSITGEKVKSFHTDLSSRTGERIIIFKLHNDLENKLLNNGNKHETENTHVIY